MLRNAFERCRDRERQISGWTLLVAACAGCGGEPLAKPDEPSVATAELRAVVALGDGVASGTSDADNPATKANSGRKSLADAAISDIGERPSAGSTGTATAGGESKGADPVFWPKQAAALQKTLRGYERGPIRPERFGDVQAVIDATLQFLNRVVSAQSLKVRDVAALAGLRSTLAGARNNLAVNQALAALPEARFIQLVNAGDMQAASRYYLDHQGEIDVDSPKVAARVKRLAEALGETRKARAVALMGDLRKYGTGGLLPEAIGEAKNVLGRAENFLREIDSDEFLRHAELRSPDLVRLFLLVDSVRENVRRSEEVDRLILTLLSHQRIGEAETLHDQNRELLQRLGRRGVEASRSLSVVLNRQLEPAMIAALNRLRPYARGDAAPARWSEATLALGAAEAAVSRYKRHGVLEQPEFRSKTSVALNSLWETSRRAFENQAGTAFFRFDHSSSRNFAEVFPVKVDEKELIARFSALDQMRLASPENLLHIRKKYAALLDADSDRRLSSVYLDSLLSKDKNGRPSFESGMAGSAAITRERLPLDTVPGFRPVLISPAESWRESASAKSIGNDFPVLVRNDTDIPELSSENASTDDRLASANYHVTVELAEVQTKRLVRNRRDLASRYLAGEREEENPQWTLAKTDLDAAREQYERVKSRIDERLRNPNRNADKSGEQADAGSVADTLLQEASRVAAAQNRFFSTPRTVKIPIYQPYRFEVSEVEVRRGVQAVFTLHDPVAGKRVSVPASFGEKQVFRVQSGLRDDDPDRVTLLSTSGNQAEEMERYVQQPYALSWAKGLELLLKKLRAGR